MLPPKSPESPERPGRLLVIEGADGTGKTTQLCRLRDRFQRAGQEVRVYDFPSKSGTPVGDLIGGFLRGDFGDVAPEFLALAFSADRMSRRDAIEADLAAGAIVLCDRYVASNIAFQSSKIADPERQRRLEHLLNWFEYEILRLPHPDLQIVLVAPDDHFVQSRHLARTPDESRGYTDAADIHEAHVDLQLAVNRYYRRLATGPSVLHVEIEQEGRRLSEGEVEDIIAALAANSEARSPSMRRRA
jgi:dTMP kinase